ncbi:uncharacterized protein BCR38DRAFT_526566 [Pseudomassariella vexata]|uniref:Extracellular membrane protein CFEM domain-containing protein n=1 Tax=Pseudomassariella vexata TaxID=1141098 RepID=A0A1Y2DL49_9PEZI|nr:uncharacterized protein BCR38DRAFT_526566 [Pseudomassariella vexata]ORY59983.1 hypothetical protein BCR38DRAFT_526566 [Pseudomassariella vexata]
MHFTNTLALALLAVSSCSARPTPIPQSNSPTISNENTNNGLSSSVGPAVVSAPVLDQAIPNGEIQGQCQQTQLWDEKSHTCQCREGTVWAGKQLGCLDLSKPWELPVVPPQTPNTEPIKPPPQFQLPTVPSMKAPAEKTRRAAHAGQLIPEPKCKGQEKAYCAKSITTWFPYEKKSSPVAQGNQTGKAFQKRQSGHNGQNSQCLDDGLNHAFCCVPGKEAEYLQNNWGVFGLFSGAFD